MFWQNIVKSWGFVWKQAENWWLLQLLMLWCLPKESCPGQAMCLYVWVLQRNRLTHCVCSHCNTQLLQRPTYLWELVVCIMPWFLRRRKSFSELEACISIASWELEFLFSSSFAYNGFWNSLYTFLYLYLAWCMEWICRLVSSLPVVPGILSTTMSYIQDGIPIGTFILVGIVS